MKRSLLNPVGWAATAALALVLLVCLSFVGMAANASPSLSATRTITPDEIEAGETVTVKVQWHLDNSEATALRLIETIPARWSLVGYDGLPSAAFERDETTHRLTWTWQQTAGLDTTLTYRLRSPDSTGAGGGHAFHGKLQSLRGQQVKGTGTAAAGDGTVVESATVTGAQTVFVARSGIDRTALWVSIIATALAFGAVLWLGWLSGRSLNMGEMRRAMAAAFVMGFTILTLLCFFYKVYQTEALIAYFETVGIVIGFYFGAKTAKEREATSMASLDIENVRFPDPTTISITVRNGCPDKIKIDKVYVNSTPFPETTVIPPKSAADIEVKMAWPKASDIRIKVATSKGITTETTAKSPQ